MQVNVIFNDNGVGLSRDARLLSDYLEHDVSFVSCGAVNMIRKADVNIFLEHLVFRDLKFQELKKFADRNFLVPNQEWFYRDWTKLLKDLDGVLCKSKYSEKIFNDAGAKTFYTSFTSDDILMKEIDRRMEFIHAGGKSINKGSDIIFKLWSYYNLPHLDLINFRHNHKFKSFDSVSFYGSKIEREKFNILMNKSIFHLCPSRNEGFGHHINEARSCGGIIITVDAPTMNELVSKEFGILVDFQSIDRFNLSNMYNTNVELLKKGVERALNLDYESIGKMSELSRRAFEDNDKFFRKKINEIIR